MHDLLMARQPILDREKKLFGYELLFRNEKNQAAQQVGGDKATSQVVVNLCTSINEQFDSLNQPLFINITDDFLQSEAFFPVNPEAVILELLESTEVDDDLLNTVRRWRQKGFRFALDDYCFEERFDPVLPLVDFLKVDLLIQPFDQVLEKLPSVKGSPCKVIAEKVESLASFQRCYAAGFDYFQGFFLAHPDKVYGKAISPNYQGLIQVLQKIQSEDASVDELSRSVSSEPRLVYQLLRILNSPACRLRRKIENIKEALVYLGMAQLKKWTLLILFTSSQDIELELVRILLTRARTCERYAELRKRSNPENFFMTGLLSGVDALLETDKETVFEQINLADEIREAILNFAGETGEVLEFTVMIENSQWNQLNKLPIVQYRALFSAFNEAGLWAHETLGIVYAG